MTGLEIALLVLLVGSSLVLGLVLRGRNQAVRQAAGLTALLDQQRPIVQAAPEVERQLQYYAAIARAVPEKDAQLQRYAGIRDAEAHLTLLQEQQRQSHLHLQAQEQQYQARAQSYEASLREQQRQSELHRHALDEQIRAETERRQAALRDQQHQGEQRLRELERQHQQAVETNRVALRLQREENEEKLKALHQQQQTLTTTLALLEGRLAAHDVGLAGPRYDFREAEEYKRKLDELRDQQEQMVRAERAAVCSAEWSINGDRKAGKKTTDAILKLMLRAFNGECDALVGRVRYDNLDSYKAKAAKSAETINKLGAGFNCSITAEYVQLKLREMELVNAYQTRLTAEREEQRAIKEQMREEQRAAQEIEKAEREAEQTAEKFQAALDKARREVADAEGAKQQKLLAQLQELERKLKEAEEKRTRALSMAQQTRAGHVYVISNVGSFGEGVFKIGMTRRLDPQDRVDELGDASVPFRFDVHAMIYTTDAPRLEKALHDLFAERRVNKINPRKEFFRVTLEEIEAAVKKHHGEFKLTRLAEAEEFRRGLALAEPAHAAVA